MEFFRAGKAEETTRGQDSAGINERPEKSRKEKRIIESKIYGLPKVWGSLVGLASQLKDNRKDSREAALAPFYLDDAWKWQEGSPYHSVPWQP